MEPTARDLQDQIQSITDILRCITAVLDVNAHDAALLERAVNKLQEKCTQFSRNTRR